MEQKLGRGSSDMPRERKGGRTKKPGFPDLGNRITVLLGDVPVSELSARTEISTSYLSRILRGQVTNPTVDFVARIAGGLGITVSELIGEVPHPLQMTATPENYLFQHLDSGYVAAREAFDAQRASEITQNLIVDIIGIIDKSNQATSDNIKAQRGSYIEEDSFTLTTAQLEFGDLIEVGETAVTKSSEWIPSGQREINDAKVNLQVRFQNIEFSRLQDNQPQSRPGPIIIDGQLVDQDGVKADFPIVRFFPDKVTGKFKLFYNFGSEIQYGSEDFQEIERIVQEAKV